MNRNRDSCHKFTTKLESTEAEAAVNVAIINTLRRPYVSLANPHRFDVKITPVTKDSQLVQFWNFGRYFFGT